MDFLMADCAVLKPRRPQIVEGRRHNAQSRACDSRQIGVTLQADQPYFLAGQHPGIRRTVRLVTAPATFKTHHSMLEGKWSAFVAMTIETSRFISGEDLRHGRPDAAVRIVAIDAGHGAFRELVMVRPLELRPNIYVTARTQLVYRRSFARYQAKGPIGMNLMTRGAGHLILDMAALQAANLRRLVEVAREAAPVHFRRRKLGGVADVGGTGAFRVFAAGTVARFTPVRLKTAPLVLLDCDVRVLLESLVDVFVANLTSFRAYIGSRLIGRRLIRRQRVLPRRCASGKKQGHRDYQRSRDAGP
jgi:hypothetical protein